MGKKVDLTGQRFGKLVVIRDVGRKNGSVLWECLCDCGNYTNVTSRNLLYGSVESCGCIRIENLEGNRYGKLIVIQKLQKDTTVMCCGSVNVIVADTPRLFLET